MKSKLELPRTLRLITASEAGNNPEVIRRIKLSETANIVEGYSITQNTADSEFSFNFFAEINIDNSRLWDLFIELCRELPDVVSLIFNISDEHPNYGEYTEKIAVIDFLVNYKKEIVKNTFIEIGMIFQTPDEMVEVFITDCKYIKFWGMNPLSFVETMKAFNLKEIKDIEFIDQYPRVRESYYALESNSKKPEELKEILDKRFRFVNL